MIWWMALLFVMGMIMILAEFLLPGGVLGTLGVLAMVGSTIIGVYTFPEYAIFIAIIEGLCAIGVIMLGLWMLSSTKAGGLLRLDTSMSGESGFTNTVSRTELIGQQGVVRTALRPAGIIEVGGERIDAVSDASFIDKGVGVVITAVEGNRVVVERVEVSPPDNA